MLYLAKTDWRNKQRIFGITDVDRRRHLYSIGRTGVGKTEFLKNCAIQDFRAGRGVVFIDPHGDAAEELLNFIPSHRTWQTVYFRPADTKYPIGLNILEGVDPDSRHLVASHVVSIFKSLWRDFWGPVQEQMLSYAVASLVDAGGFTLLDVPLLLTDDRFRARVLARLSDKQLIRFWTEEYGRRREELRLESVAPILNKVSQFLISQPLRNILGQAEARMDVGFIHQNERILIANLAGIGEQEAKLLANLLITKTYLLAKQTPPEKRKDLYLYIDEVGQVATYILENILSEARKFALNLILSHQYLDQLPQEIQSAVFGNVGTLVSFAVGAKDAETLAPIFAPEFSALDLQSLGRYQIYIRLCVDGVTSRPFSGVTLEPAKQNPDEGRREQVIRSSRERFAKVMP